MFQLKYIGIVWLWLWGMALSFPAASQVTGKCAVVAGGNINAEDIIIHCGITEKTIQRLVSVLQQQAPKQDGVAIHEISRLAKQLGVQESALENFFRILDAQQVPPEKLLAALATIAQRHVELIAQGKTFSSDDPTIALLVKQALTAIENGQYEQAEAIYQQAEAAEIAVAKKVQEIANARWLNAAKIRAERGQLSLTQLQYQKAAAHFEAASALLPLGYAEVRAKYRLRQASALYHYGDEKGNNAALGKAIVVYQICRKTPCFRAGI